MHHWPAICIACVVTTVVPGAWAADDPVRAKLDRAKAAHQVVLEKCRAAVAPSLDKREEAARKKGDKQAVDQVKAERLALQEKGELPESAPAAVRSQLARAGSDLEAAYRSAIREYTKSRRDEEAAAVQKELDEFRKGDLAGTAAAAALEAGAVWVATNADGSRRATLAVLKRNGDKVTVRYQGPSNAIVADGRVAGAALTWSLADVTKVEKRRPFGVSGKLGERATELTIRWTFQDGSSDSLTLVPDKGK